MVARLQQRVVEEYTEWAADQQIMPRGDAGRRWRERISVLLQGRADFLGKPDPTRWRSGDVHELLMDHVVPRQVDAWDLAEQGLDTIRDYLRFLDATGRLHPASTRVATLLKELDRVAAKYPAAMADPGRWRLVKRVFTAALADGIGLDADPGCSTPGPSGSAPVTRAGAARYSGTCWTSIPSTPPGGCSSTTARSRSCAPAHRRTGGQASGLARPRL